MIRKYDVEYSKVWFFYCSTISNNLLSLFLCYNLKLYDVSLLHYFYSMSFVEIKLWLSKKISCTFTENKTDLPNSMFNLLHLYLL